MRSVPLSFSKNCFVFPTVCPLIDSHFFSNFSPQGLIYFPQNHSVYTSPSYETPPPGTEPWPRSLMRGILRRCLPKANPHPVITFFTWRGSLTGISRPTAEVPPHRGVRPNNMLRVESPPKFPSGCLFGVNPHSCHQGLCKSGYCELYLLFTL